MKFNFLGATLLVSLLITRNWVRTKSRIQQHGNLMPTSCFHLEVSSKT